MKKLQGKYPRTIALLVLLAITATVTWHSFDFNSLRAEERRTIEIAHDGALMMAGKPMTLSEVESSLAQAFHDNPKLGVIIRADNKEKFGSVTRVLDVCERTGISKVGISSRN